MSESRKRPRAEEGTAPEVQLPAEKPAEDAGGGEGVDTARGAVVMEGAAEGAAGGAAEAEAEVAAEAEAKVEAEVAAEVGGGEQAAPEIVIAPLVSSLEGIPGQPYLAALHGKAAIASSVIKKLNKLDPAATSIGTAPTFLVAKATECFLATVVAEGIKAAADRAEAAPEDSIARKKPRLTYDDLRSTALSLKDAGLISDVSFLNRVLPERTKEDPKLLPPAPRDPNLADGPSGAKTSGGNKSEASDTAIEAASASGEAVSAAVAPE